MQTQAWKDDDYGLYEEVILKRFENQRKLREALTLEARIKTVVEEIADNPGLIDSRREEMRLLALGASLAG